MKKILFVLVLILMFFPTYADDKPKDQNRDHEMLTVVSPTARFTTRWCFVFDGSSSIWYKPGRHTITSIKKAFRNATKYAADELWYCVYKFSDKNREEYQKWAQATPKSINRTEKWLNTNRGVFSYGNKSIQMALRKKVKNLTIIIITDGGFTSACYRGDMENGRYHGDFSEVEGSITNGQKWRVKNGFGQAIICTIGIENKKYEAGGKPYDSDCQAFLKKIGEKYRGGYFLVRKKKSKSSVKLEKP